MEAVEALLILILLGGPSDRDLGDLMAQELRQRGGPAVTVVVGAEAHDRLTEEWGIGVDDLAASRQIGNQLTAHAEHLVLLQLSGREVQGDLVVDAELWNAGNFEHVTSIAGEGGDPVPGLMRGLMPLLADRLPDGEREAVAMPARGDPTTLAKRGAWQELLAVLAAEEGGLDPRESYYQVLAYVRLGNRDAAIAAHNRMRELHGQHFLVAAADELIPPAVEASVPAADVGGADTSIADPAAHSGTEEAAAAAARQEAPGEQGLPTAPTLD